MSVPSFYQTMATGVVLLLAVGISQFRSAAARRLLTRLFVPTRPTPIERIPQCVPSEFPRRQPPRPPQYCSSPPAEEAAPDPAERGLRLRRLRQDLPDGLRQLHRSRPRCSTSSTPNLDKVLAKGDSGLKVKWYDNGGDPAKMTQNAQLMVQDQPDAIVMYPVSATTQGISQILADGKIPCVSVNLDTQVLQVPEHRQPRAGRADGADHRQDRREPGMERLQHHRAHRAERRRRRAGQRLRPVLLHDHRTDARPARGRRQDHHAHHHQDRRQRHPVRRRVHCSRPSRR